MEISEDSADRTLVFKGKRSKRPRQLSLVGMTVAVTSTSSTGGGGAGGGSGGSSDDIGGGGEFYSSSIQYSPTTSSTQISTSSEEDEDMANCLILLAQSGRCQKLQVESSERKMVKISSRKFTEMATCTTGKAGFYVYECKTCNRTFPSFQALGGHRTSHKKAKTIVEDKKSTADSENHDHRYHQDEEKLNKIITTPTQIVNKGHSNGNFNSKPKIHECSICGAEFSSGQALGGHMRRHRPPPTITATNSTKITDETTSESSHDDENSKEKPRIILSLDLNLPAPPEDDSKFGFSANKQSLVFSPAALVDCHY
ncbi:PREDICTED: zinc finger protein ZAT5-like [Nicotiana attenuata]|uniref:Zinc finger protein zat5 n=1 Tax=Nicotiana attenuata TaxID=49451 RepID=A0A314L4K6_NICAT|nr:PREDICTED: zinc finger protein ZAT5-like [Nicotiana attenuata]OIT36472.1 zinc finger protein zat5 [Nicotiana attenuata]